MLRPLLDDLSLEGLDSTRDEMIYSDNLTRGFTFLEVHLMYLVGQCANDSLDEDGFSLEGLEEVQQGILPLHFAHRHVVLAITNI